MENSPSTNGSNGRDAAGRFALGNPGGRGNPHARQVAVLHAALLDCVTPDDLRAIAMKQLELAKAGEMPAIRELFDRLYGR